MSGGPESEISRVVRISQNCLSFHYFIIYSSHHDIMNVHNIYLGLFIYLAIVIQRNNYFARA